MAGTRAHDFWSRGLRLLPGLFLACLLVCLGTGLVLLFQYRPVGDVLAGVEAITTRAPFGFFFRRVHFAAGQCCALLALAHVLRHLWPRTPSRPGLWLRLTGAMALCFLLLATGFLLQGDARARFAATVFKSLAESVPLAGPVLGGLAAGQGEGFFLPPYVLHCFVLPLALLALLCGHVRSWLPGRGALLAVILFLGCWGLVVPLPPALAPGVGLLEARGPWFLYGLQEALRHAPPLAAGVALPLLALAALGVLPLARGALGGAARRAVVCMAGLYVVLGLVLALGR